MAMFITGQEKESERGSITILKAFHVRKGETHAYERARADHFAERPNAATCAGTGPTASGLAGWRTGAVLALRLPSLSGRQSLRGGTNELAVKNPEKHDACYKEANAKKLYLSGCALEIHDRVHE